MFQFIFFFSDWNLIKQIIASSPTVGGNRFSKNSALSFEWRTGAWVKMPRFITFSRNMNSIDLKMFPTHGGI